MRSSSSKPEAPVKPKLDMQEAGRLMASFLDAHESNYADLVDVFYKVINGEVIPPDQKELASQLKHKIVALNLV